MNWTRGISLKVNMKAKVCGHDTSLLHRKYADDHETHIQSLPTALQAWKDKNNALTRDMLRVAYHSMVLGNSYSGYAEIQRNIHQKTAAQAVDVFHDLFVTWFREYLNSPSPVTGRLRHFHLSADKGKVGNLTRQIVNIRYIDSNGAPVISNLSVDVIRHHEHADEPGRHETDAIGCFAHIRRSLEKVLALNTDTKLLPDACHSVLIMKPSILVRKQAWLFVGRVTSITMRSCIFWIGHIKSKHCIGS